MTEDNSTDTVRAGRRADRFVQVPEWILVAGLSPQAQTLYTALLAHVNHERGDGLAWPGMDTLAQLLGYTRRQTIRKYLTELVALGALDVERMTHTLVRRNVYLVHETPPPGYLGLRTLREFYAERRTETAGQSPRGAVAPLGRGAVAGVATHAGAPQNKMNSTRGNKPEKNTSGDAYAAGGQRTSSQTDRKIILPARFDELAEAGDVIHALMKCATSALKDTGLVLHSRARLSLVEALKTVLKEGHDRYYAAERLHYWINRAGTDDEGCGWLASWPDVA